MHLGLDERENIGRRVLYMDGTFGKILSILNIEDVVCYEIELEDKRTMKIAVEQFPNENWKLF